MIDIVFSEFKRFIFLSIKIEDKDGFSLSTLSKNFAQVSSIREYLLCSCQEGSVLLMFRKF
jgi:hypothetical protein